MTRCFAFILLALPRTAFGFAVETVGGTTPDAGMLVRWSTPRIPLELPSDGAPDIQDGSDLNAVRAAVDTWNALSCSSLVLDSIGTTTSTSNAATDGVLDDINRITWVNDSRWGFGSLVLGVTAPIYDTRDGEIVEADIALNGRSQSWSTNGSGVDNDVEAIVVHELGHLFGLQHVLGGNDMNDPPTMAPEATIEMRSLTSDDRNGACFLYPALSYRCFADCDCPTVVRSNAAGQEMNVGQLLCGSDQSCRAGGSVPTGTGELGDPCVDQSSCQSPLFCQVIASEAYCAQDCSPAANSCPAEFSCFPYSNAPGGACLPNDAGSGASPPTTDICQATAVQSAADGSGSPPPEPGGLPTDPCPCDRTTVCDGAQCTCDPECNDSGCASSSNRRSTAPWGWVLGALCLALFGFRRRT
ncbi:MAG: hypothetical protein AAFY60_01380 [Myxococcota bacterium]